MQVLNLGFWGDLVKKKKGPTKEPIFVLAPMADVTDAAFRQIIAKYSRMGKLGGGPDVLWTEFVSADGLFLAPPDGRAKIMKDLLFSANEHPIVAQFFTSRPEMMEKAARLALELGFDGVDINMGCPDKSIEKQGAGASLMKNPKLAQELILAAKQGATGRICGPGDVAGATGTTGASSGVSAVSTLPVSVKTRIGYNRDELATWLPALLEAGPAVVTIHARTRKEMSKVPARWDRVREAVQIRDEFFGVGKGTFEENKTMENGTLENKTLIFGNGDVLDLADGRKKATESGVDGVMFGRAIFGNPWLFDQERYGSGQSDRIMHVSLKEKLEVMVEHTKLFEELLGGPTGIKSFAIMKKHYKAYVNGFDGAAELRAELMNTSSAGEVEKIVKSYILSHF
jgi:tRNA-dihydrouridine synthase